MKRKAIPPAIKWTGSKRLVANMISQLMPKTQRLFDPFVGGGAILPVAKSDYIVAGDIIPELINLWKMIQVDPIRVLDGYELRWNRLQQEGHTAYYDIRDQFNRTRNPIDFLFLTRTCVNGLIRFNQNGDFNNSLHHTRPGIAPYRLRPILMQWSQWIRHTKFSVKDYRETLADVRKGDLIFLDPPYMGTKGRYIPDEFDYDTFYLELDRLNVIGAQWILTLDGEAGEREYQKTIPSDLYRYSTDITTGKSPFPKVMYKALDNVKESIYFNFQITSELLALGMYD